MLWRLYMAWAVTDQDQDHDLEASSRSVLWKVGRRYLTMMAWLVL